MPRLVGTGLLALDLIVQHDADGQRLSASGGGTCGNVLAILARLGWESSWLGAMGPSAPGCMLIEEMQRGGVQTKQREQQDERRQQDKASNTSFSF